MKKIKYFIPAFCIMFLIFGFSGQNGSQSSGLSSIITSWINTYLHIPITEFIIRKMAHMSEYALLALSLIYAFSKYQLPINRVYIFSLLWTFLYACTDEFHQLFIGGRAGQFTDVLIDTSGAILMIILFHIIYKYIKREK